MAAMFSSEAEIDHAPATWAEDLVWVKAADLVLHPGGPVAPVSSPNLRLPDRAGMAALEQANRRYEIVFTAFDTLARRAAAAAGLGYFPLPRSVVTPPLVIEEPGVLPDLPQVTVAIIARDDLDTTALAPLIARIKSVFTHSPPLSP